MTCVELTRIRIDGGTQPREAIDQATVDEYAESMGRLDRFPPLVVYHDGVATWLADGFHRYHAARKAGVQAVEVDWREGTAEMARLYAASANRAHGLKRTSGDKRRAIEMVLSTSEGRGWTQEQIAKHCGVDRGWVSRVVGETVVTQQLPHPPSASEKKRAAVTAAVTAAPKASDREIARRTGVDHKTVAKVRAEPPPSAPPRKGGDVRDAAVIQARPAAPAPTPLAPAWSCSSAKDTAAVALHNVKTAWSRLRGGDRALFLDQLAETLADLRAR